MYVDYICHECIGDEFLAEEVERTGEKNPCLCCGESHANSWTVSDLSSRVKNAFDQRYVLTASEPEPWEQLLLRDKESDFDWYRDGDSVLSIIEEISGLPEHICLSLVEPWTNPFHLRDDPGFEDPYGSEACYELASDSSKEIEQRWLDIQTELLHRSRFFSRATHEFLNDLFCGVQELQSFLHPVVDVLEPASFEGLYRARTAYDDKDVRTILEGLPHQLGVLRGRSVSAGRMNAAGVTVMYGAYEPATCIAEVRAPVGSRVVIGKFKLLRSIRVLNLKKLERCYERPSIFDPDYQKKVERFSFLRSLSRRLSAPVFSHNAHFDYLATQCIAEYIAAMDPKIDGVAFASSQAGGNAMNLVLFDDACHVAPLGPSLGEAHFNDYPESDYDMFSGPNLLFDASKEQEAQQAPVSPLAGDDDDDSGEWTPKSQQVSNLQPLPTLELDLYSLHIHKINAVTYDSDNSKVVVSHS